jgi:hypothetical protein
MIFKTNKLDGLTIQPVLKPFEVLDQRADIIPLFSFSSAASYCSNDYTEYYSHRYAETNIVQGYAHPSAKRYSNTYPWTCPIYSFFVVLIVVLIVIFHFFSCSYLPLREP